MKSLKLYRVVKQCHKGISNSGRMVLLEKGREVHLKPERHVRELMEKGYLKEVKDNKKAKKKKKKTFKKKQSKKISKKVKKENKILSEEPKGNSEEKMKQE